MTTDCIVDKLERAGYEIVSRERLKDNHGDLLRLSTGGVVTCYDKGTFLCQGKGAAELRALIEPTASGVRGCGNKKVFVVYGHDIVARTQLEAMLRRWDLQPLILDQLESSGMTVIEKLEEYISQANYGVVLATPDDVGYPKDDEGGKKYRVRQNVVLEMGMLLAKLGRTHVAILLKNTEDMERPSDIHGLVYIPFVNDVEESKVSLAKELQKNGYNIDLAKL